MKNAIRNIVAVLCALVAGVCSAAEAPISYNLYRFAYRVKYEDCRLAIGPGDSFSSLELGARLTSAIPFTWHPQQWKGWFFPGGASGGVSAGGTGGTNYQLIGGGLPFQADRNASATINASTGTLAQQTNRYGSNLTAGTWTLGYQQANESTNPNSFANTLAAPTGPDTDYLFSIPCPWREFYVGTGSFAAVSGQTLFTFLSNYRVMGLIWDRTNDRDWTTQGDSIYARVVFYGSDTLSPATIGVRGFRDSTSPSYPAAAVSVATNITGYSYGVTECGAKSTANGPTTNMGVLVSNNGAEMRGTTLAVVGCLFYRPTLTTGLTVVPLAGGGARLADWASGAAIADTGVENYLSHAVGVTPGVDGPTNGPNAYFSMLGTNVTTAEANELNAGTYTNYKASLKLMIARIKLWSSNNGVTDPLICLATPYLASQTSTFMSALANAMYECALEDSSVAFVNTYRLMPHARNNASDAYATYTSWHVGGINGTGNDARWLAGTSELHTTMNGSMAVHSAIWTAMESALQTGTELRVRNRPRQRNASAAVAAHRRRGRHSREKKAHAQRDDALSVPHG